METGNELTEDFLMDEIHPKKNLNRSTFARPPPPNRGNRRLTKAPASGKWFEEYSNTNIAWGLNLQLQSTKMSLPIAFVVIFKTIQRRERHFFKPEICYSNNSFFTLLLFLTFFPCSCFKVGNKVFNLSFHIINYSGLTSIENTLW